MLFQKKRVLKSVANGSVISLSDVNDDVFSTNMMGVGYAVQDHDGKIYSPVDGEIADIFPTLHAITIKSNKGDTILVHMGLDTVDLKGAPFELNVSKGQSVSVNDLLATMDLEMLEEKNKDSTVVVVLPEQKKGSVNEKNESSITDNAFKF